MNDGRDQSLREVGLSIALVYFYFLIVFRIAPSMEATLLRPFVKICIWRRVVDLGIYFRLKDEKLNSETKRGV